MSSKEEIKILLTEELKTSNQYQECLLIKQFIKNQINEPNIVSINLVYNFTTPFTNNDEISLFKLCFKLLFGWIEENMNNEMISIDLSKFLN
jgi:hypothetical protein